MNRFTSPYEELLFRLRITRESRFSCTKRLIRRHKRSYFIISMMSLFVIMLSVLPNVYALTDQQQQVLLAITILNSVFIIVTTLIDVVGEYSLKSHFMRVTARKLSSLLNEVVCASEAEHENGEWVSEQYKEYQRILDECPFDHLDTDYLDAKIKNQGLFPADEKLTGRRLLYVKIWVHYTRLRWWLPHAAALAVSFTCLIYFIDFSV